MKNKASSRKFWVWIVWAVITTASMIPAVRIDQTVVSYFGFVSLIYIGGNVLQKWIDGKRGIGADLGGIPQ